MRFESLTVARRLALMLLVALAGMVLLAFAALYENRDDMRDGYARNVRSQIELATGVLAHFHSLEQAGALALMKKFFSANEAEIRNEVQHGEIDVG